MMKKEVKIFFAWRYLYIIQDFLFLFYNYFPLSDLR